jgi:hypothetical protein
MHNTSFKELNSNGVIAIAERFGYTVHNHPPSVGPCPVCESLTRHNKRKDKRLSVNITHGGYGWYCIQCEAKGDAVGFAAYHILKRKAVTKQDWIEVHQKLSESFNAVPLSLSIKPKLSIVGLTARPDWKQVLSVWNEKLSAIPKSSEHEFILSKFKGCTISDVVDTGIIKFQDRHKSLGVPWFPWSNLPYGHVLCFDEKGRVVSLHARALVSDEELDGRPKTRFPKGYSASGLLLADKSGVSFLRGGNTPAVVFTEGLTSTVAASSFLRRSGRWNWAVIGVTSGSASAVKAIKYPPLISAYVWTDVDNAGEKYAERIREAVPAHVNLMRVKPT